MFFLKTHLKVFCGFVALFGASLSAEIKTINKIEEAKEEITKDSVVFIDLNYTMIYPKEPALGTYRGSTLFLQKTRNLPFEEFAYLGTKLAASIRWELIEDDFVDFTDFLKKQGILAACLTGSGDLPFVGKLPYSSEVAKEEGFPIDVYEYYTSAIKSLAIEFGSDPLKEASLTELSLLKGCMHKEGVLFLNHQAMGSILPHLYKMLPFKSERLVVIDDELLNLRQLEMSCKEKGIPFLGLYYRGFEKLKRHYDKGIAKIQLEKLINEKEILFNEEASLLKGALQLETQSDDPLLVK